VKRASPEEDVTDKSLVSEIVVEKGLRQSFSWHRGFFSRFHNFLDAQNI
jgi:hypothetical protein